MSFFSRLTGVGTQPASALSALSTARISGATGVSAAPVTAAPSTVFVELGEAAQQASIARNGVQVPIVTFDPAQLGTALGQTITVPAKVVSQSIQPGVSVAKGTSVDLVLAEPSKLPVSVLQGAFQPFATQSLDEVYKNVIRDNTAVQSVLARNQSAAALSTADQATLTAALGDVSVTGEPGNDLGSAFQTLQAAFTFGT